MKLYVKLFVRVFVFFCLLFGAMVYVGDVLEPFEAAPIILVGAAVIALTWVLADRLLDNDSNQDDGK